MHSPPLSISFELHASRHGAKISPRARILACVRARIYNETRVEGARKSPNDAASHLADCARGGAGMNCHELREHYELYVIGDRNFDKIYCEAELSGISEI